MPVYLHEYGNFDHQEEEKDVKSQAFIKCSAQSSYSVVPVHLIPFHPSTRFPGLCSMKWLSVLRPILGYHYNTL